MYIKSIEKCNFFLKSFSNFNLGLLFVISISNLPPISKFQANRIRNEEVRIFYSFYPDRAKNTR